MDVMVVAANGSYQVSKEYPELRETFYCDGVWFVDRDRTSAICFMKREDIDNLDMPTVAVLMKHRGRIIDRMMVAVKVPHTYNDIFLGIVQEIAKIEMENRVEQGSQS